MIPTNDLSNRLQMLLKFLSMIEPVSASGPAGEENKKAMEFFHNASNGWNQKSDRTISLDHSVKIINSLLCNQYDTRSKFNSLNANTDSYFNQTTENSSPNLIKIDKPLHQFVQSSVTRTIHLSSQNTLNFKQFALVYQSIVHLIEVIQSIPLLTKNINSEARQPGRNIVANQLKPATNQFISNLERRFAKEPSQRIENNHSVSSLNPIADSSSFRSAKIGERGEPFQPPTSCLPQKQTVGQSVNPASLSVKLAAIPVVNASNSANFPVPQAQAVEVSRFHPRGMDKSITATATDGQVLLGALPFPGVPSNGSFLVSTRKKERKKKPNDDETEERESLMNRQSFDL